MAQKIGTTTVYDNSRDMVVEIVYTTLLRLVTTLVKFATSSTSFFESIINIHI